MRTFDPLIFMEWETT